MAGVSPVWQGTRTQAFERFAKKRIALAMLVAALSHPKDIAALRDEILRHSNYNRRPTVAPGRWKFGSEEARLFLNAYLAHRAGRLLSMGHRAEAKRLADAALLLESQDSCLLGRCFVLAFWIRFGGLTAADFKGSAGLPRARISYWKHLWMAPVALRLPVHSQKAIERIYRRALERKGRVGRRFGAFAKLCHRPKAGQGAAAKAMRISLLHVGMAARDPAEWAFVIRNVAWFRNQALRSGNASLAGAIASQLGSVTRFVRADKNLAYPDKAAILRWIKEAMGP